MTQTLKKRIAVLGGGPAGMAAAFRLSAGENRGKYDITVYQMGARLGGKCATTRGPGNRIQEHGIHMLFGFYEETWAMLREAYAAAEPLLPENYGIKKLTDAFEPHTDTFALAINEGANNWVRWQVNMPLREYDPRVESAPEPFDKSNIWVTITLFARLMLAQLEETIKDRFPFLRTEEACSFPDENSYSFKTLRPLLNRSLELLNKIVGMKDVTDLGARILGFECKIALVLLRSLLALVYLTPFVWLSRFIEMAIMTLASFRGILHQRPTTYKDLDTMDFNDFLIEYGMPEHMRMNAIISCIYLAAFSHTDVERTQGQLSAGAAINMVTATLLYYRGAAVYYFRAGTADIMITPIYRYLINEGVKFHFFNKVTNLHPGHNPLDGSKYISSVDIDVQAELKGGPSSYHPLYRELKQGLHSYPEEPFFDQMTLASQERVMGYNLESYHAKVEPMKRITLRAGLDYDAVVCGIPVSALEIVSEPLSQSDQIWKRMVTGVKTIPTFGAQFWFTKPSAEIKKAMRPGMWGLCNYVPFMDFALDFSQTVAFEGPDCGKTVYYSCSSWQTEGDVKYSPEGWPVEQKVRMVNMAHDWFQTAFQKVTEQNQFDYNLLEPHGWKSKSDEPISMRVEQQWFTPNVEPAELYTLSVPNSMKYRMKPDDSGYANLTLCGDWTDTYWNFGCVEATVSSSNIAAAGTVRYLESLRSNVDQSIFTKNGVQYLR